MSQKNYTEVLIDGAAYTLGGDEDEGYLRRVAAYLNEKIGSIKSQRGFSRQNADYQTLMIQLNIADDYFKEQERADILSGQKASLEKEAYSLKHELITTQIRLETLQKELEAERQRRAAESTGTEKAAEPEARKPGSGKR
ncbi:MAG: cell division protein ZapA [Eubacteriales bacterium]|nr:cell division protein ZapA [Eubacteriales bacterium]